METKAPEDKPTTGHIGLRGLFMLLYIAGFAIGQALLNVLAIVQFVWLLATREPNDFIASFGNSLSIWLAEIGRFLTAATDETPFPFRRWPDSPPPPHDPIGGSPQP